MFIVTNLNYYHDKLLFLIIWAICLLGLKTENRRFRLIDHQHFLVVLEIH